MLWVAAASSTSIWSCREHSVRFGNRFPARKNQTNRKKKTISHKSLYVHEYLYTRSWIHKQRLSFGFDDAERLRYVKTNRIKPPYSNSVLIHFIHWGFFLLLFFGARFSSFFFFSFFLRCSGMPTWYISHRSCINEQRVRFYILCAIFSPGIALFSTFQFSRWNLIAWLHIKYNMLYVRCNNTPFISFGSV